MCSLNVLPAVGSNVTVHITRVNLQPHCTFVEFGGNFSHGQLTREIYQQMKKEIQIHIEQVCDFEGKSGDVCLVEEEKRWHRARILSRCGNKYNVFLIDDGRTLWVSSSSLAWGQSSFFSMPPMMELFIMASVSPLSLENRWSPTASEFLKSLSGKTVCGCVQDVMMPYRIMLLDIPSVFKQMQEFGFARKIPSEEFHILVVNSLCTPRNVSCARPDPTLTNDQREHASHLEKINQYLCPELLPGTTETVEVTQVVNPLHIFCKLHVFSHELKKLSQEIQEYYESTSAAVMLRPLPVGSPCATKGSDGKWYRSILQQNVGSSVAKVFHVDYGIKDFVQLGDIRRLATKFLRLPVVTYACSLLGIVDKGFGWTTSQIEHLKSILLNQIFVGKFEYRDFSCGIYDVTLYGNDSVNINSLFAVQEKCLLMPDRACPVSPSEIQSHEIHRGFPKCGFAVHSVSTSVVSHDSLPPENTKMYGRPRTDLRRTVAIPAEEMNRRPADLYQAKVESILDELLFTVGSVIEVNVSYVESDQRFWCQMAAGVSGLKLLMEDIQRHYSCAEFQLPTGSVCVARHPDNGTWYRAKFVNHHQTPYVDVRLVDYGQLLKVPLRDLRPIEPRFLKLKCQAFQCSLSNTVSSGCSKSTALNDSGLSDSFDLISPTFSCNISLKCTIHAVMYDSQGAVLNIVDIESLPLNLCTSLQKEVNISAVEFLEEPCVLNDMNAVSTPSINVGTEEKVWITCVESVNHFYGQLKRNADIVAQLNKDIKQHCAATQHARYSFSPQMMCVAKYNDSHWYRGQIKAVNPKLLVHFVDYGDVLALDEADVLPFPAQLTSHKSIPFQAVQFRLFSVTLQESSELNNWFDNLTTDCTFNATVMGKSPSGKLSVELHDGKTNINLQVKEKWNEIRKKEHNTKEEVKKRQPMFTEPLWRRDPFNPRRQALKQCESAPKSADPSSITRRQAEKVQCTGFAVCASLSAEKQINPDKHVSHPCSKLEDLPSRTIKAGFVSEVFVSHCNSPSSFFVQLANKESDICSLVDELNCAQLDESPVHFDQLLPGHLVKAEFPLDGAWYRAVVKNKLDDCTIQVEFLDFGNEATLSVSKVMQLSLQFLKFPRYSIHCSLTAGDGERNREWTKEQTEKFKNATVTNGEKKLLCNFIKENASVWQVSIEDQGLMLAESLLNMECPVNSGDVCAGIFKKPEVSIGQIIETYASSITGPIFFWCQYANSKKLDKISLIAQEAGNSAQTNPLQFHHLSPGDSCLALFPDDNMWYRAQVINKSESSVSVLFIDYGNESEVGQTSVKAIPISLLEDPPQAFLCQLEGFKPTEGCWNEAAADHFSALVVDKLLKVTIQNAEVTSDLINCLQYLVQVECNMDIINGLMKDYWNSCTIEVCGKITDEVILKPMLESINCPVPPAQCFPQVTDLPPAGIEQDLVSEVYISYINSPSSFFVQLTKDENRLTSLTEELNSTCSSINDQIEINSVPPGSLVKAVFPDDDSWYRAVIRDANGKDIHVEFLDFGNEATVTAMNVHKLDRQFLQFPRFSVHCCLSAEDCVLIQMGTEQGTCPLVNVLGKAGEKKLFCKFIKECETVWEVKIADQRSTLDGSFEGLPAEKWHDLDVGVLQNASPKEVLSEVIQTTNTVSLLFKRPEISVGQTIEAYASSIVGPHYFWCQHANSEELDKIFVIAQEVGNSAQTDLVRIDLLRPGDTCIARFTDELWYRAQVIRKSLNSVCVLFVDFGNEFEAEAASIKPLPVSLLEGPLQAFLCQLEGFSLSNGSWHDDAMGKFCELIVDKPLTVTVKMIQNDLDSPSPSHHVTVHSKECVVIEQMKRFWSPFAYANENPRSDMRPGCASPHGNEETVKQDEELERHKEEVSVIDGQCSQTRQFANNGSDQERLTQLNSTVAHLQADLGHFSGSGLCGVENQALTTVRDSSFKAQLDEFWED